MPSKIHSTLSFATYPDKNLIRNRISDFLAANGFNEMMGLSLSQEKYYETLIPKDKSTLVYVNNTSNVTFNVMRPDLLIGMLEAVRHNQNRQSMDLKLFEFGKSYEYSNPAEKEIKEKEILTIALTGNRFDESWERAKAGVSFYSIKAIVEKVLEQIGIQKFQLSESEHEQFAYGMKFHRGANDLVEFGMIDKNLVGEFDIRNDVFFANFNWEEVVKASKNFKYVKEINKFPQSRRDLALVIDNGVKFEDIVKIAKATEKKILKKVDLFDVYINKEQLGADKKSYAVSFIFESADKTLKDKDIDKVMNKCIDKFQSELGATIR
jgi:phenylalanyl-tRNA synthetase beta chain